MKDYSFIDYNNKDFLRNEFGKVIILKFSSYEKAEDWLLSNGEKYGWTNGGIKYYIWD